MEDWFEVNQYNSYLYVIRERLDLIEPRFLTQYTNLYLIMGDTAAVLFDTGSGLGDLKNLLESIVNDRELVVINSHNHFDHVGGNHLFDETHIHRMDFKKIMKPMDLDFLQHAQEPYVSQFAKNGFKMHFADHTIPLIGNDVFDLGGREVEVFYTPGHTPGSICLRLHSGEIFTGDTLNYGSIYLPDQTQIGYYEESVRDIQNIAKSYDRPLFFPGHEAYGVGKELLDDFHTSYTSIDWSSAEYDQFLQAEVLSHGKFTFVRPS